MDGEYTTLTYESASARIKKKGRKYIVTDVWASERGQGHGTGLMKLVSEYADGNRMDLELIALPSRTAPIQTILNHEQLVEFYRQFGFEIIGWTKPVRMLRLCKTRASRELRVL